MNMAEVKVSSQKSLNKIKEDSEILIWLKSYSDLFSPFDPRPYQKRALSDDFLSELKKASKVKNSSIELKLFIPEDKKSIREESLIKERLREYFKRHYEIEKIHWEHTRNKSFLFVIIGILSLAAVAYFRLYEAKDFASILLRVILEPAGWFMAWVGLERVFYLF